MIRASLDALFFVVVLQVGIPAGSQNRQLGRGRSSRREGASGGVTDEVRRNKSRAIDGWLDFGPLKSEQHRPAVHHRTLIPVDYALRSVPLLLPSSCTWYTVTLLLMTSAASSDFVRRRICTDCWRACQLSIHPSLYGRVNLFGICWGLLGLFEENKKCESQAWGE